ncbi:MAG TPA: helix-turn-helix domain-containing protein [Mycobacteriales bacterium]
MTGLEGLVRPDGSVVVPGSVAGEVLAALVRDLTARIRADGGEVSPAARRVLYALHSAAQCHDQVPDERPGSGVGTVGARRVMVEPLTAADAAGMLECSTGYVRRLCRTGRLTARRTASVWLIDPVSLDAYAKGTTDARPDAHPRPACP